MSTENPDINLPKSETAFPINTPWGCYSGMTLRDYFAAKAMQAVIHNDPNDDCSTDAIAKAAYRVADAMLAARKEGM